MASNAAKRYAQAVVAMAKSNNSLDEWQRDLDILANLLSDEMADRVFANPNISARQKREVIASALPEGRREALNLASLLLERGKISLLPEVARIFTESRLAERGIAVAEVTTAEPLNEESQAAVRTQLQRLIGKDIELRLNTDPQIIGGIVARVGDQLIDGSVIAQLRRLRARLAAG